MNEKEKEKENLAGGARHNWLVIFGMAETHS